MIWKNWLSWLLPIGLLRLALGGDSSSSSSNTTQTTNIDKRQVVDAGGIGVSSDSSTVTVNALDGDIVKAALDTVKAADATAGEGFSKLLDLAGKVFDTGANIVTKGQEMTNAAYQQAATEKAGTIDNKTIMVLGVAGAAAYALSKMKG